MPRTTKTVKPTQTEETTSTRTRRTRKSVQEQTPAPEPVQQEPEPVVQQEQQPAQVEESQAPTEQTSEMSLQTQHREQFDLMRGQVRQIKQLLSELGKELTRQEKEFRRSLSRSQKQSRTRSKKQRNSPPNTRFSQELVNYINANLNNDDIHVEHDYVDKETGERRVEQVDIENINTDTLFRRTDCTKLLCKIFNKKELTGLPGKDGRPDKRKIKYYDDDGFMRLLRDNPDLDESQRQALLNGESDITIFTMQTLLKHHMLHSETAH